MTSGSPDNHMERHEREAGGAKVTAPFKVYRSTNFFQQNNYSWNSKALTQTTKCLETPHYNPHKNREGSMGHDLREGGGSSYRQRGALINGLDR
ncbi:hypothetical protein NDU88_007252 [Pleurodeles waltl]|uniref:Uncharacterized protein n=1 Tax=Pleurodeles waltl TaxID=8319 RepID=A0AAV7QRB9_PLEWA|nr:hypothetical protein NDU88_007252 [Pleurodeles waltl]